MAIVISRHFPKPMQLRTKTFLLVSLPLLGFMTVLYLGIATLLQRSFTQLEDSSVRRNVLRIQEAIAHDLRDLSALAEDWATWDATYQFAQNQNQRYIEAHLNDDIFDVLDINFILYFDPNTQLLLSRGYDLNQRQRIQVPSELATELQGLQVYLNQSGQNLGESFEGFLDLGTKTLLVVARPIHTSHKTGESVGQLVMARYLDQEKLQEWTTLTQLPIQQHHIGTPSLTPTLQQAFEQLTLESFQTPEVTEAPIQIKPLDAQTIVGYTLLYDLKQQPAVLLEVKLPRSIYEEGQVSLRFLELALVGSGSLFIVMLLLLLNNVVLKRLMQLIGAVNYIGESHDLAHRIVLSGQDELKRLAQTLNWMLQQLQSSTLALQAEQLKTQNLLHNVLPAAIVAKLQQHRGRSALAERFDEVSILFADLVGFTPLAQKLPPEEIVTFLDQIFCQFDALVDTFGLEKIKTIGDAYMVAAGLPIPRPDHLEAIADLALAMQALVATLKLPPSLADQPPFQIRIGVNTGSAVAGIIGQKKFSYDLWGHTVNVASRMESTGEPGKIHVTQAVYQQLCDRYHLKQRGMIEIKGIGSMTTYWLYGRKVEA